MAPRHLGDASGRARPGGHERQRRYAHPRPLVATTLRDIRRALVPGGTLAFETRNPAHEAWRSWNDPGSTRSSPFGEVRESVRTTAPDASGVVTMTGRTTYVDRGETIESTQRLQFRHHDRLVRDLTAAGLSLQAVWQDWNRTPYRAEPTEPLMFFEAHRPL